MNKAELQHAIIVELKRLAEENGDPKCLSRGKWRTLKSDFSERSIRNAFGTFSAAQEAAGLETDKKEKPDLGTKKFESQLEKYDLGRNLLQKFHSEITPFIGAYERLKERIRVIMSRSDDHAQWLDPWCDDVFWDVARRIQPTDIVFDGDTVDFWEISNHSKNPRRAMTLQSEIDFVVMKLFRRAREEHPDADIHWVLGNHEWRLFRYLSDQAPALSSLRCLQFDRLFDLKELRINLVASPSFLNSRSGKDIENYKIFDDCYVVTHGTRLGKQPAQSEIDVWGKSGSSGHVHRYTTFSKRDLNGFRRWNSNGAMCQLKSGEEYIWDLVNWTQGFNIIHIDRETKHVYQEYADLSDDFACIGGKYYFRKNSDKESGG